MVRRLFAFAVFLSLLVGVAAAGLWVRTAKAIDTIIVRTSWSYTSGPDTKWVVLRTYDGMKISLSVRAAPALDANKLRWRVRPPGVDWRRDLASPRSPGARPMTAEELREYEARIEPEYVAADAFRWEKRPPVPARNVEQIRAARAAAPFWKRLGFGSVGAYGIYGANGTPGYCRTTERTVPFWAVVAAAAVLPACWAAPGLWRRVVAARRRRRGDCVGCGYDLRSSPAQCPECGRVADDPAAARRWWPPAWLRLPRPRPMAFVARLAALAVLAALVLALASDRPDEDASIVASEQAKRVAAEAERVTAEKERLRRDLDGKLAAVAREAARLRAAGDEAGARQMESELAHFRARAAGTAQVSGDEPELHGVGVRVGNLPHVPRGQPTAPHPRGSAVVEVRDTGRPIVLALSAYEPVRWELRLVGSPRLKKVILGGYYRQEVSGVPADVEVEEHTQDKRSRYYFHAHRVDDQDYPRAVTRLRHLTGLDLCTFQGREEAGVEPFVVGKGNADWETQRLLVEIEPLHRRAMAIERERQKSSLAVRRFPALLHRRTGGVNVESAPATFDPTGPLPATAGEFGPQLAHLAVDPLGPTYYGGEGRGGGLLVVGPGQSSWVRLPMPAGAPRGVAGMAFDTRRRRLVAAAEAGRGPELHAYVPESGQWARLGTLGDGQEVLALTYSAEHDCLYAITLEFAVEPAAIMRLTPDGVPEWRVPLADVNADRVRRFGPFPGLQVAAVGPHLALILPPPFDPWTLRMGGATPPDRCLLIDPLTAEVIHSGDAEPHDALPSPGLAPAEMERLWDAIAAADVSAADEAMWQLAAAGEPAVEFLRAKPAGGADGVRRERAMHVLSRVGTPAAARLLRELAPPR